MRQAEHVKLDVDPGSDASLLQRAARALERGDFRAAHGECLTVLQRSGPQAEAWYLLGIIAAEHGNYAKAAELFDRAIGLEAGDARYHAQRAKALVSLLQREGAREAAARAEALAPADALTLDTLGVVHTRLGDHATAIRLFERAVAADPGRANFHYNLAASRQFAGDFDAAGSAYQDALALDPGLYKAWSALVQLRRQSAADNHIEVLTALFGAGGADGERDRHLGHALAKSHEDLGDHAQALAWLKRAKAGQGGPDPVDHAVFAAARAPVLAVKPGWPSERPIFVTGLPRTGTTLADRILSSHSQVSSAGELTNFALIAKRMTATPGNLVMDAATLEAAGGLDLAALGQAYEDSAAHLVGRAPRFVDKMPLNFVYAGLIHAALPRARIICLRRHPMDACLSNYRQLFATGYSYYAYANDLEDCGRYYLEFDRLCRHWRETLPTDRYMEIAYEDIVADLEGSARALLSHCGLDWEAQCLDFHQQSGPVATASSVQVRQPIYSSSVGRWRRYGAALDGLRAVLAEGGVLDADGEWLRGAEIPAGLGGDAV